MGDKKPIPIGSYVTGLLYEDDIVEGFEAAYVGCVFVDCEFTGLRNIYFDCVFRHSSGTLDLPDCSTVAFCFLEGPNAEQN